MTENIGPRAVRAHSIRGAVIMTGNGASFRADAATRGAAQERLDTPPPAPAEKSPDPASDGLARAADAARRADDITGHALAVAARVGLLCRWVITQGQAALAFLLR